MPQVKVRVNDVKAVLLTVRSAPTQTVTLALEEPVAWVSLVVKVAVFGNVVQVPAVRPE
jgi:hypothetical protein